MGEDRENLPHPVISDRKIVFPRYEASEDEIEVRRIIGWSFVLVGGCGCGYIAPIPLMGESEVNGRIVGDPMAPLYSLIIILFSLFFLVPGIRMLRKDKG
ncbi:hypothetical protein EON82_03045 [bacterium]|nr:MAG: hypothetical protein EON82_03045 [bacterium]